MDNMYISGNKDLTKEKKKITSINQSIKDYSTDYGKGIIYYTCDGKEVATMEEVIMYNQIYYEKMKIQINSGLEKNGRNR